MTIVLGNSACWCQLSRWENQIGVGTEIKSFVLPTFILKCLVDVQTEMSSGYEPVAQWWGIGICLFKSLDDII